MFDQFGLLFADAVNALQRIAVALEELVALETHAVEKLTAEPDENPGYGPGNPDWERDFAKTRETEAE